MCMKDMVSELKVLHICGLSWVLMPSGRAILRMDMGVDIGAMSV